MQTMMLKLLIEKTTKQMHLIDETDAMFVNLTLSQEFCRIFKVAQARKYQTLESALFILLNDAQLVP